MKQKKIDRTDAGLLEQFYGGDKQALAILLERHIPNLKRTLFAVLQNHAEAEDILQETLLKAYDEIRDGKYRNENFPGWLFRIARNKCTDHFRRMKKRWKLPLFEDRAMPNGERYDDEGNLLLPSSVATAVETIECRESHSLLHEAISRLSVRQREIVVMFYFLEMRVKTIALLMGISINTVIGCLHYARRHLKRALQPQPLPNERIPMLKRA